MKHTVGIIKDRETYKLCLFRKGMCWAVMTGDMFQKWCEEVAKRPTQVGAGLAKGVSQLPLSLSNEPEKRN